MTTPVLAIDPSSTRTGYAVAAGPGDLLEAGVLRSSLKRAVDRIRAMVVDLDDLLDQHRPGVLIVEIPDGTVHRSVRGRSAGAGLSVYGMTAGALLERCWAWSAAHPSVTVRPVTPTAWNNARRKAITAGVVSAMFPGRDWSRDVGHDATDAVGMLVWWFEQADQTP